MTPPDGTAASTPAITQAVVVEKDRAYTVAAVGRQADLSGKVPEDDLTPPSAGTAKIRLLQAAVSTPSATVTAVGGPALARDAVFGSSTGYAEVPAGIWTIAIDPLAGDAPATDATVTAKPGSVSTLIVLDRREGGLTARTITDAAGAQKMPTRGRGVETGGGGLAGPSLTASR